MGVGSSGRNPTTHTEVGADKALDVNVVQTTGGGGGGTEYTEDAAAAADPVGGAQILVRQDTPAALVTTDGDNVARRGTDYGAAFSQIVDSSGAFIDTFGGGTQYTQGDIDATITGTAMMAENANELLPLQISNSDNLRVSLAEFAVTLDVDVTDTVLATGASTSAKQDTIITDLGSLLVELQAKADLIETQPVSAASLPLPSGAATSALQLADGHNVTVDNAAGASAVNIQDGGNSITVDAASLPLPTGAATQTTLASLLTELQAKADLAETQPVSAASLPLPTGAATAALQLADGHNVTVDNAAGASAVNIQDGGNSITVDATTLPLPTGAATEAKQDTQETTLNAIQTSVEIMDDWDNAASDGASISGDVAHDSADAGEPAKVGFKAFDIEPDTAGLNEPTPVAANDRSNLFGSLNGRLFTAPFINFYEPTLVSDTYDNVTTTQTSAAIECWHYRKASLAFGLTKANAPTDIRIDVEVTHDGTNWRKERSGPLGQLLFSDTAVGSGGLTFGWEWDISAHSMRIVVTATGTTASATFTVGALTLCLRD